MLTNKINMITNKFFPFSWLFI